MAVTSGHLSGVRQGEAQRVGVGELEGCRVKRLVRDSCAVTARVTWRLRDGYITVASGPRLLTGDGTRAARCEGTAADARNRCITGVSWACNGRVTGV